MTKFQPCTQNAEIEVMSGKQRPVASQIDGDNLDLSHAFFKKMQMEPVINKKGEQKWKKYYVDNHGQRRVKFVKKCPNALFQTLETRGVNREIAQAEFRGQKRKRLRQTEEKKKQAAERGDGCLGLIEAGDAKVSFSLTHLYRALKMIESFMDNEKDVFGEWSAVDEVKSWNGVSNRGAKEFIQEMGMEDVLDALTSTDHAVSIDVTNLLQSCNDGMQKMVICLALLSMGTGDHNKTRPSIRRAAVSLVADAFKKKLCEELKKNESKAIMSLCLGCLGYLKCWSLVEGDESLQETLSAKFATDLGDLAGDMFNPFEERDILRMKAILFPKKSKTKGSQKAQKS